MFRALKQFAILVVFLLLSVFSALYFQEEREDAASQTDNEASIWVINTVKKAGNILASIADLSLAVNPKLDFSENEQFASWEEVGDYDFNNSEALAEGRFLAEGLDQTVNQSEFRQFFNDFLEKIPTLYLDAKIYSNAWRNIGSFDWLREK